MYLIKNLFLTSILLITLLSCQEKRASHEIMVCGDNKVLILDKDKSNENHLEIIWEWSNQDVADQLPESYQKYLATMDECKFVNNNTQVLLTASSGGVVLIDRASKKCLFHALAPMAHSADLLPNDRIIVALSTNPKGNSIELYDINKPEQVIWKDSLYSGHGTVWMESRKRLYALGYDELREYSLKDWNTDSPGLQLEKSWKIPHKSGHDLSFVSNNELLISDHHGVSLFDIDKETFSPFHPLHDAKNVKSVNFNKEKGSLIYTIAEESWWTFNIYLKDPSKVIHIPDIKLYKVRTNPY